MWTIICDNEYAGESPGKVEGLFHDKAVADKVCKHLNACAKAGQEEGTGEEDENYNNLHELFYGVYKVQEVPASKTAKEWLEKLWWGRNYMEEIEDHPTFTALKAL